MSIWLVLSVNAAPPEMVADCLSILKGAAAGIHDRAHWVSATSDFLRACARMNGSADFANKSPTSARRGEDSISSLTISHSACMTSAHRARLNGEAAEVFLNIFSPSIPPGPPDGARPASRVRL